MRDHFRRFSGRNSGLQFKWVKIDPRMPVAGEVTVVKAGHMPAPELRIREDGFDYVLKKVKSKDSSASTAGSPGIGVIKIPAPRIKSLR